VYGGVLDDLWFVVIDELKSESGDISEKGNGTSQRSGDAAPGDPSDGNRIISLSLHCSPE
jgi:hypothetical protein